MYFLNDKDFITILEYFVRHCCKFCFRVILLILYSFNAIILNVFCYFNDFIISVSVFEYHKRGIAVIYIQRFLNRSTCLSYKYIIINFRIRGC